MTLSLNTTIVRTCPAGDAVECDVLADFSVVGFTRGYRPSYDPPDPGNADEYHVAFDGARFDGGEPDDAPGPLTEGELATVRAWFDRNHDAASDLAARDALS